MSLSIYDWANIQLSKTYYINGLKQLPVSPVAIGKDRCVFVIKDNEIFQKEFAKINVIEFICEYDGRYLCELLSEISEEKTKFGVPVFFNIGIPYNEIHEYEYQSCLNFISSLEHQYWNPYVNIIIDSFKTSLFSEEENPYLSNGVPLVTKAINNISDFDGITGYISDQFSTYNHLLTNNEKISLNKQGILTTSLLKNEKVALSCGCNLLKTKGRILGDISNAYLIRDLIQNIASRLNAESTYGEIKTTIDSLMSEEYADVIRKYSLDIEAKEEKKEINRAVRLELYIVGFIKGLQTIIYLG
jgi:hypothetical protein